MSKNAEITVAIQNDRPSITIRISTQEDGEKKLVLRDMLSEIQEAITKFQAKPQSKLLPNTSVEVRDESCALPLTQTHPQNNAEKKSDHPKMISDKQINLLLKRLRANKLDVRKFCQDRGVSRLEDFTMATARELIQDLAIY